MPANTIKKLERYGVKWDGHRLIVSTSVPDGCWTPWHLAEELIQQQANEIEALKSLLSDIKLFEVDSGVERIKKGKPAFAMPLEIRKRMQDALTGK